MKNKTFIWIFGILLLATTSLIVHSDPPTIPQEIEGLTPIESQTNIFEGLRIDWYEITSSGLNKDYIVAIYNLNSQPQHLDLGVFLQETTYNLRDSDLFEIYTWNGNHWNTRVNPNSQSFNHGRKQRNINVNLNDVKYYRIYFPVPAYQIGKIGIINVETGTIYHPWYNSLYRYKKEVIINNPFTTFTNMPILVRLNTSQLIAQGKMQSDCDDILFTNYSENAQVNFAWENRSEKKYGCSSGEAVLWTRYNPVVTNTSTDNMWLYYNNPSATANFVNFQPWQDFAFWWLFDSNTSNSSLDRTGHYHNLTINGTLRYTPAGVGYGINLTRTFNSLMWADSPWLSTSTNWTWGVQFRLHGGASTGYLLNQFRTTSADMGILTYYSKNATGGYITTQLGKNDGTCNPSITGNKFFNGTANISLNTPFVLVQTYNGTRFRSYINGVLDMDYSMNGVCEGGGGFGFNINTDDNSTGASQNITVDNLFWTNRSLDAGQIRMLSSMLNGTFSNLSIEYGQGNLTVTFSTLTPDPAYEGNNLNFSFITSDGDTTKRMNATIQWHKNDALIYTDNENLNVANQTSISSILYTGNFTDFDNISVNARLNSGLEYGNWSDNLSLMIGTNLSIFGYCNSTLNVAFVNYTFRDEYTGLNMSATLSSANFRYSAYSDFHIYRSYSYSDTGSKSGYNFCYGANQTIYLESDLIYHNLTLYPARTKFLTGTYNQNGNVTILDLLATTYGIYETIQVLSPSGDGISGATVTAEKYAGGVYTLVQSGSTDSSGVVQFFLDPNYPHRITVTKEGYNTYQSTIQITGAHTIILGQSVSVPEVNYYNGISMEFLPSESILKNSTVYNFNFTVDSNYWSLQQAGFILTNQSGSPLTSTVCSNSAGCTASVNYNTSNYQQIIMNYFFKVNETYLNFTHTYQISRSGASGGSAFEMFIRDFRKFGASMGTGNHAEFTKAIIAFIIIIMVVGSITYFSGVYSPLAILLEIFALTAIFDLLGFIPDLNENVPHAVLIILGVIIFIDIMLEYGRNS
jgi:hypothetical protein